MVFHVVLSRKDHGITSLNAPRLAVAIGHVANGRSAGATNVVLIGGFANALVLILAANGHVHGAATIICDTLAIHVFGGGGRIREIVA
jgi:hypothetical protein